ncbi:MAG TPA: hypothetical protein VHY57_02985, partial [Rhizomicrobium sp.]|nr:hypothetical protein [Rhizomicrobium sp.]
MCPLAFRRDHLGSPKQIDHPACHPRPSKAPLQAGKRISDRLRTNFNQRPENMFGLMPRIFIVGISALLQAIENTRKFRGQLSLWNHRIEPCIASRQEF